MVQVCLLLNALQDIANETVPALGGGAGSTVTCSGRLSISTCLPEAGRRSSRKDVEDSLNRIAATHGRGAPCPGGSNADTRSVLSDDRQLTLTHTHGGGERRRTVRLKNCGAGGTLPGTMDRPNSRAHASIAMQFFK